MKRYRHAHKDTRTRDTEFVGGVPQTDSKQPTRKFKMNVIQFPGKPRGHSAQYAALQCKEAHGFDFVGKHVGDITTNDIAFAMAMTNFHERPGVEFDVDQFGTVTAAVAVDLYAAEKWDVIETTANGLTAGAGACPRDILEVLQLGTMAKLLETVQ